MAEGVAALKLVLDLFLGDKSLAQQRIEEVNEDDPRLFLC